MYLIFKGNRVFRFIEHKEGYDNYRYRAIARKQDLMRFLTNRSNVIGKFIIHGKVVYRSNEVFTLEI